jgi:hypothetical protein
MSLDERRVAYADTTELCVSWLPRSWHHCGTTAFGVYHWTLECVIMIIRTKIAATVDASPRRKCPCGCRRLYAVWLGRRSCSINITVSGGKTIRAHRRSTYGVGQKVILKEYESVTAGDLSRKAPVENPPLLRLLAPPGPSRPAYGPLPRAP